MSAQVHVVAGPREVARLAAELMARAVRSALAERGWASVCLPAGRGVHAVLDELAGASLDWSGVEFHFSEERGVTRDHPVSSWAVAAGRLLENPRIAEDQLHGIDGCAHDLEAEAARYAEELPERFDVMLMQPDADGSLGALCAGSPAFEPQAPDVLALEFDRTPRRRWSVGPRVLRAAREVVVTACGPERAGLLQRASSPDLDPRECPVALLAGRTWVLDRGASALVPSQQRRAAIEPPTP